jgi:hypothetical protein
VAVHKISEHEIPERLRLVAPEDVQPEREDLPPAKPRPSPPARDVDKEARDAAVLVQATATMVALAKIVSTRAILLLSVLGALGLAVLLTVRPSWPGLLVMAFFVLIVGALVALEGGLLARSDR